MQEHPKYGKLICKPNLQGLIETRKNQITVSLIVFIIAMLFSIVFLIPAFIGLTQYCFMFFILAFCGIILIAMVLRAQADSMNLEFYEHGFIDHYASSFRKHEKPFDYYYRKGDYIYGQNKRVERFRILNFINLSSPTIEKILTELKLIDNISTGNKTMPIETVDQDPRSEYDLPDSSGSLFILFMVIFSILMLFSSLATQRNADDLNPLHYAYFGIPVLVSVLVKILTRDPPPTKILFYNDLLVYIPWYKNKDFPDCINYSIALSNIEKLEYWNHWYRRRIIIWYNHERILGGFQLNVSFLSKEHGVIERIFQDLLNNISSDAVVNRK